MVELGSDAIGAIVRYVNAVHGLTLASPFVKLAGAGLMPERAKPRARRACPNFCVNGTDFN